MVDTISSLGSIDYRHDEWGVDVTVGGSQKGLMLPPGLVVQRGQRRRRWRRRRRRSCRASYLGLGARCCATNADGFFPYTPATNLLYGLREAIDDAATRKGSTDVFARHDRHAEATRRAVRAWGLEVLCADPTDYSSVADRGR